MLHLIMSQCDSDWKVYKKKMEIMGLLILFLILCVRAGFAPFFLCVNCS